MISKSLCLTILSALGTSLLSFGAQADSIYPNELVGTWKASNCSSCYLQVTMGYGGQLYGDMNQWGNTYGSFSGGPQPIYVYSGSDQILYRGDLFQVQRSYNQISITNLSYGGSDRNVGSAWLSVQPSQPVVVVVTRPPYSEPRRDYDNRNYDNRNHNRGYDNRNNGGYNNNRGNGGGYNNNRGNNGGYNNNRGNGGGYNNRGGY